METPSGVSLAFVLSQTYTNHFPSHNYSLIPVKMPSTRGGGRVMQTWQEKLAALETENIKEFVATASCGCEHGCIQKICRLGEAGLQMVHDLRHSRLSGMCTYHRQTCLCVVPNAMQGDTSCITVIISHPGVGIIASCRTAPRGVEISRRFCVGWRRLLFEIFIGMNTMQGVLSMNHRGYFHS